MRIDEYIRDYFINDLFNTRGSFTISSVSCKEIDVSVGGKSDLNIFAIVRNKPNVDGTIERPDIIGSEGFSIDPTFVVTFPKDYCDWQSRTAFSVKSILPFLRMIRHMDKLVNIKLGDNEYYAMPRLMLSRQGDTIFYTSTVYKFNNDTQDYETIKRIAHIPRYTFENCGNPLEKNIISHILPNLITDTARGEWEVVCGEEESLIAKPVQPEVFDSLDQIDRTMNTILSTYAVTCMNPNTTASNNE